MLLLMKHGMRTTSKEDVASVSVSQSDLHSSTDHTDEDELATVCNFEEDNGAQAIDLPVFDGYSHRSIAVNVTKSTDVKIRPVTQFYAPVTIHQHFTKLVNNKDKLEKQSNSQFMLSRTSAISTNLVCILGIVFSLIIAVTLIVIMIYFITPSRNDGKNALRPRLPDVLEGNSVALDEDVAILTKERWGGYEMRDGWQNRSLSHPVELVIIGHTASSPCSTFEECASKMQTFQNLHVQTRGWVSIGYNFVIGGDGNVYQALGWDITNYTRDNSIMISFIGNYVINEVKNKQRKAVQLLLEQGVELGKLASNYKLVAHCQVANTLSPGQYLLADLKQWPHYYAGLIT
ncbi:peptidoglycan-recognition protein SA-like isoform X1 [Neodiprion virginianus]|uniref:peptidoglycan-recognition protein SA-like isoform X1 n=1 Tax=Neodiprion virginianus TaxID=2961670 RepID=UPI001EE76BFC|nr:peptidoglycan-recognition protein SA-like isoform X1 [Neodiprion virginianus]